MVLKLSLQQKYWIFFPLVLFTGLYIFTPTSDLYYIKTIVEWKLEFMPWISIKNLMIGLLGYMWYKIFVAGR